MARQLWARVLLLLVAVAGPALGEEPRSDGAGTPRYARFGATAGFGWSMERQLDDSARHLRLGLEFEYPIAASFSVLAALREHAYQRDYLLDRFDLGGDGLARVRLAEHKVDAEAFFLYHLGQGKRLSAAVGLGPSFRFFVNEALPSNVGGLAAVGRASFLLFPRVDVSASAAYTYNLFFAGQPTVSALGSPLASTAFGANVGLLFLPRVRLALGYEGEAITLQNGYRLFHSVSLHLSFFPGAPEAAERTAVAAPPAVMDAPAPALAPALPGKGALRGVVVDAATKKPLADAIISVPGRSRVLADSSGAFLVADLAPGTLVVSAGLPGFEAAQATVEVAANKEVEVKLQLAPRPKPPPPPPNAVLRGAVISEKDEPLAAKIEVAAAGIAPKDFATGAYELKVPTGEMIVEASAAGYVTQGRRVVAKAGETIVADFILKKVPKKLLVVLRKEKIEIKKQVHFSTNTDVILPDSSQLLDEVAAIILDNPSLSLLRIEGHTDDKADDAYNQSLSERRARAVVRALIERGVAPSRLTPVGFGEVKPIASNKTEKGRATNRRVEFMIERSEP